MIKVPIFFSLNKLGITGAQKELRKLTNQTKAFGLTSKLSIGAASVALTAYTKKAITAAIADEKAQKALAQSLKNLGLQFETVGVSKFIDNLQRATGVSEDLLRPAFQRLILVLGDVGKAQKALSLAMDISAGTGKDLNAVSLALSKGYSGQTTALSRLGAGLDKALLKSGDMEAITAKLSELFAGQALVAADTYAGQMAILGVAAQEASETIGVALIDALVALSGENGVADLAIQMETLAQNTANTVTGMAEMARLGKEFAGVAITIASFAAMLLPSGKLAKPAMAVVNLFKSKKVIAGAVIAGGLIGAEKLGANKNAVAQGTNRQSARATEQAAIAANKINKAKQITVDLNKKIAASEKLKGMFDIDSIQIAEALKGKISDLDRARLKGMTALKTEATNDDIAAIKKIEFETIRANAAANSSQQLALQNTFDFYKSIFGAAKDASDKIHQLSFVPASMTAPSGNGTGGGGGAPALPNPFVAGNIPDLSYLNFDLNALGTANANMNAGIAAQQTTTVNMNFPALGFIGNAQEMASFVQQTISEGNRNGYSYTGLAGGE